MLFRTVKVIRLIAENTVEEGMLRCAQAKLRLEQDVTMANGEETQGLSAHRADCSVCEQLVANTPSLPFPALVERRKSNRVLKSNCQLTKPLLPWLTGC